MPVAVQSGVQRKLKLLMEKRSALMAELARIDGELAEAAKSEVDPEIQRAAEMMSQRHGRSVQYYIDALQEDPFEGYDKMVAEDLARYRSQARS